MEFIKRQDFSFFVARKENGEQRDVSLMPTWILLLEMEKWWKEVQGNVFMIILTQPEYWLSFCFSQENIKILPVKKVSFEGRQAVLCGPYYLL